MTVLSATIANPVFKVTRYGDVDTTGATDSSAPVLAAILDALKVGGTVELPVGVLRVDQQISIPVMAAGVQQFIRIEGQGRVTNWQINGGNGGSVLDLGTPEMPSVSPKSSPTARALEIDHLTLADEGTSSAPFLGTVGTLLHPHAHDPAVTGNPFKSRETCDQDVLILSGTAGNTTNDGPNPAFQGYGTVIERVLFAKIRSGVVAERFANSIVVAANSFSNRCGANNDQGAIEFDPARGQPSREASPGLSFQGP